MIESTGRGSSKTRTMIDFIICASLLFDRYRLYNRIQKLSPVGNHWIGKLYGRKLPYAGVSCRLLFKTWSDLKGGCNIRHQFLALWTFELLSCTTQVIGICACHPCAWYTERHGSFHLKRGKINLKQRFACRFLRFAWPLILQHVSAEERTS